MKKILPALFVLLTLGVGGAAVYLIEKPAAGATCAAASAYLPADTVLLLAVPDLNKTVADWKTTDLYKIWMEPEVQAFMARPLSKVPPHDELDTALAQTDKLGLTNLFAALTAVDEETSEPRIVAGFQFKGSSADVDKLLAQPKEELRKQYPAAKADLVNYEGHAIETVVLDDHSSLASLYLGNWYLVSNDLPTLEATVDRAEHRGAAARQPTLEKDADYAAVLARMPTGQATMIFGRPKPFMSKLFDLIAASGQAVDPKQRAEAEKIKAIGATTGFENGKMRDTVYALAPGISLEYAKLTMGSMPLTTNDTVLYTASMLNIPAKFDLPGNGAASPGLAILQNLGTMLAAHHVTLDSFRAAFGNEVSIHVDWPADRAQPTLIASLDVRDPAAAGKFVDNFTDALSAEAAWETSEADGLTLHSMEVPNVGGALTLTLTVTPKHLLFGLNPPEVREAAAREKTPAPNFTASQDYKAASAEVEKPNTAFAYLDTKTFFERFYGTLKPYVGFAAVMTPQVSEYVDLGKLPAAETISRHLQPTIYSQTYSPDGCLLESAGSFTFAQATTVIFGATVAVAMHFTPPQVNGPVEVEPPAASPSVSQ